MAGFIKDNKIYIAVAESDTIRENRLAGWNKSDSVTCSYYISDREEVKNQVISLLDGVQVGVTAEGKALYEYQKPVYTSKKECKIFERIMKTRVKEKYSKMFENEMVNFDNAIQIFINDDIKIASKMIDTGSRPYFTFDGNENWKDFLKIIYGEITYIVIENIGDRYLVYPQFHPMFIKSNEFEVQYEEALLDDFNVFGIHINKENTALNEDDPHVCIGWSEMGDLNSITSKDELKNRFTETWPQSKPIQIGIGISQIWMFLNDMKINDYVVFFNKGFAHIGKILSNYYYDNSIIGQDKDYVNNKKVEWIKEISYKELPSEYKKSANTRRTVFKLNSFKSLVVDLLGGKEIQKDELDDVEDEIKIDSVLPIYDFSTCTMTTGENLIIYGTPGCGKSYFVKNEKLKEYHEDNCIRTTFYQDYTNTDFVGQILPHVEGDKVTYKFIPGPFTLALEKAIRTPNEKMALVIEELNRGAAASIFGDIFQLLDRKNGLSEYSILNVNIVNYLNDQFKDIYEFEKIKIPGNLSIYATMNTSDQNVYTLDTAFKRRWKFKKLQNVFTDKHTFRDSYIPGADITWENMVTAINDYILDTTNGLNNEDKQLGVFFVDETGMRKDLLDKENPEEVNQFAHKILEYLWGDVAKFDHKKWFPKVRSLDELIEQYMNREVNIKVFNDEIFKDKQE